MTNPAPNDKPLWHVMRHAYVQSAGTVINHLGQEEVPGPRREEFAAMLRAIADVVAPEEPPMSRRIQGNAVAKALYLQRQRIRALLLAEADRAEAGES